MNSQRVNFMLSPTEETAFCDQLSKRNNPEGIPYRALRNVAIFDSSGELVRFTEIECRGPFKVAASVPPSSRSPKSFWHMPIYIENIYEYSLEFPYGEDAVVWLRSQKALYTIESISPSYLSLWEPTYAAVNVSGHVINALLNVSATEATSAILEKISILSRQDLPSVLAGIRQHREFILQQIKLQERKRLLRFELARSMRKEDTLDELFNTITELSRPNRVVTGPVGAKRKLSNAAKIAGIEEEADENSDVKEIKVAPSTLVVYEDGEALHSAIPLIVVNPSQDLPARQTVKSHRRSYEKWSVLEPCIQRLRIPLASDVEFACPVCNLTLYPHTNVSLIEAVYQHICLFHCHRESRPDKKQSPLVEQMANYQLTWPSCSITEVTSFSLPQKRRKIRPIAEDAAENNSGLLAETLPTVEVDAGRDSQGPPHSIIPLNLTRSSDPNHVTRAPSNGSLAPLIVEAARCHDGVLECTKRDSEGFAVAPSALSVPSWEKSETSHKETCIGPVEQQTPHGATQSISTASPIAPDEPLPLSLMAGSLVTSPASTIQSGPLQSAAYSASATSPSQSGCAMSCWSPHQTTTRQFYSNVDLAAPILSTLPSPAPPIIGQMPHQSCVPTTTNMAAANSGSCQVEVPVGDKLSLTKPTTWFRSPETSTFGIDGVRH